MLNIAEGVLLFAATAESVLGVLGNAFIGLVNCVDCVRRKKFSAIDIVLTGLVISRIVLTWIVISDAYIKVFSPQLYASSNLPEPIIYLWIIVNHMSIWFATSLSIFYFFKIASFSHYIFLWLKRKFDAIFILLIGCLFLSWLIAIPQTVKMINKAKMQYGNTSWQIQLWKTDFLINHVFVNIGSIVFFMMALITCFLLIIFLWRHNRRMQSTMSGFRDLNSKVHVKAMKVLIALFVLLILYFIGISIQSYFFMMESKVLFLFGLTVALLYPCSHSFILILANSQLKRASVRALQLLKCWKEEGNLGAT